MKKNFLPAELVIASDRWYIKFYQTHPVTGKLVRHRPTFNLNRIKNLELRKKRALEIIEDVNKSLYNGYPYNEIKKKKINIFDALDIALKFKVANKRINSINSFNSQHSILTEYLRKYIAISYLDEFTEHTAVKFMDYLLIDRGYGNRHFNTHLAFHKSLFAILIDKGYINSNPFGSIKTRSKTKAKSRRIMTAYERDTLWAYFLEHNYNMYLVTNLMYYCFLRPNEIRFLKFEYFNLQNQTIRIPDCISKNGRERVVTIPSKIIQLFRNKDFAGHPAHYFVFGQGWAPGPEKPISKNQMYNHNKKALLFLVNSNKITDMVGLTLYCWKDTGITDLSKILPLPEVQIQAGHTDPKMTMVYYHRGRVSSSFKDL